MSRLQLRDLGVLVGGVGHLVGARPKDHHAAGGHSHQVLGVAAGQVADRLRRRPRLRGADGQEAPGERVVGCGLEPAADLVVAHAVGPLGVGGLAGGDDRLQLRHHGLGRLAWDHAPVHLDQAGVGHHVGADAALDHAHVDARRAEQRVGASLKLLALVALQVEDQVGHAVDRVAAAPGVGGVGGAAAYAEGGPQHALVGRGDAVVGLLADHDEVAGGEVPLLGEPLRAQHPAHLLLGGADHHQSAAQRAELLAQVGRHLQHRGHGRLVVHAAEAVDPAPVDGAAEGVVAPAGVLAEGHRVDMGVVHQRWPVAAAGAADHAPGAIVGRELGGREAALLQEALAEFGDGPAVAGRVGRGDADEPSEQLNHRRVLAHQGASAAPAPWRASTRSMRAIASVRTSSGWSRLIRSQSTHFSPKAVPGKISTWPSLSSR